MREKILYYLGAGASANVLPLARSVYSSNDHSKPPLIPGLLYELKNFKFETIFHNLPDGKFQDYENRLKSDFRILSENAERFGDVDTYAKYLHLLGKHEDLDFVKQTLSQYFSLKQTILKARDPRYLPWLVSLMDKREFPDNVKILSWNYDYQVELASGEIGPMEGIEHTGSAFIHSPPVIYGYPNLDPAFSDHLVLSLVHLNGIAGFRNVNDLKTGSAYQEQYFQNRQQALDYILNEPFTENFHFAWERSHYLAKLLPHVQNIIQGTSILVVIGYSFPFFNRVVDKEIFKILLLNNTLHKIYYQDPVLDGQQLQTQFDFKYSPQIKHIRNLDNFHIPFEL
jgi:hypothetical protein